MQTNRGCFRRSGSPNQAIRGLAGEGTRSRFHRNLFVAKKSITILTITASSDIGANLRLGRHPLLLRETGEADGQPAGREYLLRRTQQDPYRNSATMAADALRQSACTASGPEEVREQRTCCCRCRTRPARHAPPDRRGSTESNQMPIPRRQTAAASAGSSHHRRTPTACTAVRGPQTRRAPSRRFAPVRPGS